MVNNHTEYADDTIYCVNRSLVVPNNVYLIIINLWRVVSRINTRLQIRFNCVGAITSKTRLRFGVVHKATDLCQAGKNVNVACAEQQIHPGGLICLIN